MKESYLQINNQNGFFLPFVLFISLIMFSSIMTSLLIYQNENKISHQLLEQMKVETIVQMTKTKFKIEGINEGDGSNLYYRFPSGDVNLSYDVYDGALYYLNLDILTDSNYAFQIDTLVVRD